MSDQENYDDFMMSDDDMDSIEMEDEENDTREAESSNTSDSTGLMEKYQRGINLMSDEEFIAARGVFLGLLGEETIGDELALQVNSHILRCWCQLLVYSEPESEQYQLIRGDFERYVARVNDLHGKNVSLDLEQDYLNVVSQFQSNLVDRIFIFDVSVEQSRDLVSKLQFKQAIFEMLQGSWVFHKYPRVKSAISLKQQITRTWIEILSNGNSADVDTSALISSFQRDQLNLDELQLVLQCYVSKFLNDQEIPYSEGNEFKECIRQLESKSNDSLAIAQRSDINLILHLCKALYLIMFEMDQEEMVGGHDERCIRRFVSINKFYQNISHCKEEFWECLKSLEELGTNKFHFDKFMQIIVGGFVLCAMILKKPRSRSIARSEAMEEEGLQVDNNDINPFEYEQLRIAPDHEFIAKLQTLYEVFTTLRVDQMYHCLVELDCLRTPLARLFDQVCYLVQKRKLFDEIAPVYSQISISDLRRMIQIHPANQPSRDEILIHLMRYRMQDKSIDFKLDFTKDIVYFHEEQTPIATLPKRLDIPEKDFFDNLQEVPDEEGLYLITKLTTESLK